MGRDMESERHVLPFYASFFTTIYYFYYSDLERISRKVVGIQVRESRIHQMQGRIIANRSQLHRNDRAFK